MKFRRIVSLTLLIAALLMLTSSIVLYIVPQGRVAYWAGWELWGLSKSQWGSLHTNAGFLMLIAAILHTYYNWRPITNYLKNKAKKLRVFTPEVIVALALSAAFVVLTLVEIPPLAWIQDLREHVEDTSAEEFGEPPYGHAELSSLRVFMRNVGLEPARAKQNLAAAGIEADDPEIEIIDLAQRHGLSPEALYQTMLGPEDQRPQGAQPIPTAMPKGAGRMTLAAFCEKYNRDLAWTVSALERAGLQVNPDDTLKSIAAKNGREPLDLLDILREADQK